LLVGLFTRPVAFVLSGQMAVAYFLVHAPQDFWPVLNQGELAILYCFTFLYFASAGGGVWSLDAWRGRETVVIQDIRRAAYGLPARPADYAADGGAGLNT
jgi:putative oxidoreductase